MSRLAFALLADGASDRALLPIIRWALMQFDASLEIAQPGFRVRDLQADFASEMRAVCAEFTPQVLFVHRDAEAQDPEVRRAEVPDLGEPLVRVVPVRMTEAWLLFDEQAIRTAAGNPRGRVPLTLPAMKNVEGIADPKQVLHECLLAAAEVAGRRRKQFRRDLPASVQRTADLIDDFTPLRQLPAFRRFEEESRLACRRISARPS